MGNNFGRKFRVTTFGESHGGGIGVVVEVVRRGLVCRMMTFSVNSIATVQVKAKSPPNERSRIDAKLLSGVFEGQTLGTPITVLVRNEDARPEAYETMRGTFRPPMPILPTRPNMEFATGWVAVCASARETIGRVAAAAIAGNVLATLFKARPCTSRSSSADRAWLTGLIMSNKFPRARGCRPARRTP